ncbi:hypothetical protein ACIGO8_14785 [Streptomyces sp. NPDC053493]|uniref:hypothetical protein n=1 Tax=Streptomyces sp. NPDC053493 TaxID=3365705 RepID=UPI0037CEF140
MTRSDNTDGFAVLLGAFRRTTVLAPVDPYEETLTRFARAQGEPDREWEYHTVLGARLPDGLLR